MRKETIVAVGVVAFVVVAVLGWLIFSVDTDQDALPAKAVVEKVEQPSMANDEPEDNIEPEFDEMDDFVDAGDETRIIVVEPGGDEISNLLSEKVIKDGKIIDKQ